MINQISHFGVNLELNTYTISGFQTNYQLQYMPIFYYMLFDLIQRPQRISSVLAIAFFAYFLFYNKLFYFNLKAPAPTPSPGAKNSTTKVRQIFF